MPCAANALACCKALPSVSLPSDRRTIRFAVPSGKREADRRRAFSRELPPLSTKDKKPAVTSVSLSGVSSTPARFPKETSPSCSRFSLACWASCKNACTTPSVFSTLAERSTANTVVVVFAVISNVGFAMARISTKQSTARMMVWTFFRNGDANCPPLAKNSMAAITGINKISQ